MRSRQGRRQRVPSSKIAWFPPRMATGQRPAVIRFNFFHHTRQLIWYDEWDNELSEEHRRPIAGTALDRHCPEADEGFATGQGVTDEQRRGATPTGWDQDEAAARHAGRDPRHCLGYLLGPLPARPIASHGERARCRAR